jgi:hypothetical protein
MSMQLTRQGPLDTAKQTASEAGHGRLRAAWRQIRYAAAEINHASHRVVEWQAPWIVDARWHSR